MMNTNNNGIVILNINGADHCWISNIISNIDPLNLLKNSDLTKKGVL